MYFPFVLSNIDNDRRCVYAIYHTVLVYIYIFDYFILELTRKNVKFGCINMFAAICFSYPIWNISTISSEIAPMHNNPCQISRRYPIKYTSFSYKYLIPIVQFLWQPYAIVVRYRPLCGMVHIKLYR